MRTLRIIYNNCAEKDASLKQYYPFGSGGRGKFRIPDTKKGSKKGDALTKEQLKKFMGIELEPDSPAWEARNYWLFSFYCQGMNFRDICHLKNENISNDAIRYVRQKTIRTEDEEIIEVPLSKQIIEIRNEIGSPSKEPKDYVFPILSLTIKDPLRSEAVMMQKLKTVNSWLKSTADDNGLPKITTYWARHTYASLLKLQGTAVEEIRELLGHSDIKTTEHYLKRFDLAKKKKTNAKLFKSLGR